MRDFLYFILWVINKWIRDIILLTLTEDMLEVGVVRCYKY